jgi:hypothetical protein
LLQAKDAVGNALENVKNTVTPEKKWGWWCSSRNLFFFESERVGRLWVHIIMQLMNNT